MLSVALWVYEAENKNINLTIKKMLMTIRNNRNVEENKTVGRELNEKVEAYCFGDKSLFKR